ncbi:MAG: CHC2 zinc finger domain-containing protein [Candidatus Dojkabacteria bacterium]|nr:CHC2 zinc finger domain-containing protein [Candidatus Dojkabacteria bacterium]
MMYDQDVIERVRAANPIEEVVSQYTPLKNGKGVCPFHDDHDPSFSVSVRKQIGKCFVCMDRAVDVFGFIMMMEKVTFPEAVRILADKKAIKLQELTEEQKKALEKQKRQREILRATAGFYHKQLLEVLDSHAADDDSAKAIEYIQKKGFDKEVILKFKLGMARREGLCDYLIKEGFSETDGIESGVLSAYQGKVREFYEVAIVFPIMVRGEVVSFTGRMLADDAVSKFKHLKGEISYLYNEDVLRDADEVMLCEGPVDTITAEQYGFTAVGILGSQAFKESYLAKFRNVSEVYSCLDADAAGTEGTKKLNDMFFGDIKVIKLPEGMDLNDYFNS